MFKLISKLKLLKSRLKEFSENHFGSILERVICVRDNLLKIHRDLIRVPNNDKIIMEEKTPTKERWCNGKEG